MASSTMATTTTLAGEQSPTLRANMKSASESAPIKHQDQDDQFFWSYTEEPHRSRRMAIIKAHPEVLKLCGPEPLTIPLVLAVVGLQCTCAYLLSNTPFWSWRFWLTAYIIGATANQNLFLAIHEISHNLAFKSGLANRLLAIVANLPIGIPYSASFRVRLLKYFGIDQPTDFSTALPLDPSQIARRRWP
jgi:sphingolipid delta-4 desaturase